MSQFDRTYEAAAVLVEKSQAFCEIFGRLCFGSLAYRLHDRQEHVETDSIAARRLRRTLLGVLEGEQREFKISDLVLAFICIHLEFLLTKGSHSI